MFDINGYKVKDGTEYLKHSRTKITTTIRSEYYNEYKKLMKAIDVEYCKGFDIMIELLSEDEDLLDEFVSRAKRY